MNVGKFFAAIFFGFIFTLNTAAAETLQDPAMSMPLPNNQPPTVLSEWNSTNSGLNPGFTVQQMQNPRPVPPGDVLPNVTATSAIVIEASTGHIIYSRNHNKNGYADNGVRKWKVRRNCYGREKCFRRGRLDALFGNGRQNSA